MRLLLGLLLVSGCTTNAVRSSGLVPQAQPAQHSGQPIDDRRTGVVTAGVTDVVRSRAPRVDPGADYGGMEVPRTHVQLGVRQQVVPWFDLGMVYEEGPSEGATRTNQAHPPMDDRNTHALGYTMQWSAPIRALPGLRIGVSFDLWVYSIPYISYRECVADCWLNTLAGDPDDIIRKGRELMPVINAGVRPSYKLGPVALFGLLEVRNQPTIMAPHTEVGEEEPVELGEGVGLVGGGIEVDVFRGVKLLAQGYRPFASPIDYGSSLAFSVMVPVFSEPFAKSPTRRSPEPAATPASSHTAPGR